ncbi:MAG: TRAP transporter TatT component family protein [Ignavibacteriota bacterium]
MRTPTWWPRDPFGLKLYEGLLAESPSIPGCFSPAASGFTEYSYAFIDLKAEEAKEESVDKANALRERARKMYLRAHGYAMRGLEVKYPVSARRSITMPWQPSSACESPKRRCSTGRPRRLDSPSRRRRAIRR